MLNKSSVGVTCHDIQINPSFSDRIIKLAPNFIYIYDLEKQCNIYWNPFLKEILGYADSELESINKQLFSQLIHPEDLMAISKHHQNCLQLKNGEYLTVEYRVQHQQGDWYWLESKDTVFEQNASGKPTQILGIAQDITQIKQNQGQATKINRQLQEKVETLVTWREQHLKFVKMNEFLQGCLTIGEAKKALSGFLQPLFPRTYGAVYLMNHSINSLEAIATWGAIDRRSTCKSDEFLQQLDLAVPDNSNNLNNPEIYSPYLDLSSPPQPSIYIPLIAWDETIGVFHLCFTDCEPISEPMHKLSATVARNIALSLASIERQERLRDQSLRDPLTKLYNRRYLKESLEQALDRAQRKQQFLSIIMIDIDHFKNFNDVYGHAAGDLVLKKVSTYLLSQIRQYDIACRYGGEELVIVMPDASLEDTVIRAEGMREGVKQLKLEYSGQQLESITISIGVSCFPDDGITSQQLIEAADRALYQAKALGRDRVQRC